jgi:hypothetical protein
MQIFEWCVTELEASSRQVEQNEEDFQNKKEED